MPDNKDMKKKQSQINKMADRVKGMMDTLYQRNYYSQSKNVNDLSNIRTNMSKSIDHIIDNNVENIGVPNISKLYSRLTNVQNDTEVVQKVNDMFSDDAVTGQMMSAYMANKYLVDLDNEIDVICKYLPKLDEALDTRKDNVLSADHFTKDFITVYNPDNNTLEYEDSVFHNQLEDLKEKYNLENNFDKAYSRTSKYGEQFIWLVDYKTALAKLLKAKNGLVNGAVMSESCSLDFKNGSIISETSDPISMGGSMPKELKSHTINIELNETNMLNDVIEELYKADSRMNSIQESSIAFLNESIEDQTKVGNNKPQKAYEKLISDSDVEDFDMGISSQELLVGTDNKKQNNKKLNVPGCIQKFLDRAMVLPIYIDNNICMGYFYFETMPGQSGFIMNNRATTQMMSTSVVDKNMVDPQALADNTQEEMMKYMAAQISTLIDAKFINMNQDLTKEIYSILKTNDLYNIMNSDGGIRVTFIPPDDMVHMYFDLDDRTHRGISDLAKALLPAKLYTGLYITNTIASMTRGQDKRVYYVKQSIDTNIANNLLNTINQIKKSNFGIRQIDSAIEQVLNITGRFNDYIIPVGPSGDSPIQFEVMQGQNIDIKTDLMNMLEELAINATDVPLEAIQARQSLDYAIQMTMTNSRFLRKVYKRQSVCNKIYSQWITKLYNSEYGENKKIKMILPPPMFLNITNVNQVFNNTNDFVNSITEMTLGSETDDTLKALFKKNMLQHYLGSYLDSTVVDEMLNKSKQEAAIRSTETKTVKQDQ